MSIWIEPIFDRTNEDVSFAQTKIQEWITAKMSGTIVETYELKGCLNVTDINRIEGNIQYLSDRLNELNYPPGTSCKVWERSGLPTEQDIRRILKNIRLIITAFYQQNNIIAIPDGMNTVFDINSIEENLYSIKQLLDSMVDGFQKSGMLQSGGMRMLPIRR